MIKKALAYHVDEANIFVYVFINYKAVSTQSHAICIFLYIDTSKLKTILNISKHIMFDSHSEKICLTICFKLLIIHFHFNFSFVCCLICH